MFHHILAAADHIGAKGRLGVPGAVRPQQAAVRQVIQPHCHRGGADIHRRAQAASARCERRRSLLPFGADAAAGKSRHIDGAVPFCPVLAGQNALPSAILLELHPALAAFSASAAGCRQLNPAPAKRLEQGLHRRSFQFKTMIALIGQNS